MFKKSFVVLSVLASFAGAMGVQADTATHSAFAKLSAPMTRWNLDPNFDSSFKVDGARILVNLESREIELTITRSPHCVGGRMCPMFMPMPIVITLPMIGTPVTDRCGTVNYIARADRRPVDGPLETLVVKNNTGNHCPHFVALADTQVSYSLAAFSRGGDAIQQRSTFEGERLLPQTGER